MHLVNVAPNELIHVGLPVLIANHYITKGAQSFSYLFSKQQSRSNEYRNLSKD